MVKLSQIAHAVKCYLALHGDKEVTSIATCCGTEQDADYEFNLHDVYDGPIGSNPYSGKDSIIFLKDGVNFHCKNYQPQVSQKKDIPDDGNQLYVAVVKTDAVRDVQVCQNAEHEPLSGIYNWINVNDAEIWLGLFWGPDARDKAAIYGNTDPANIRLIPIPNIK